MSHAIPRFLQGPRPDLREYWFVVKKSRNTFFFVCKGIHLLSLLLYLSLLLFLNSIEVRESDPSSRVDREAKKKIRRALKSCESKKKQKKNTTRGDRGAKMWKRCTEVEKNGGRWREKEEPRERQSS